MTAGGPEVFVHTDGDEVTKALSARLLARLTELQGEGRLPQVALTGGRIATKAYGRLASEGAHSAVDWSRVELWWGDERFVAADDEDRNDVGALDVLATLPLNPDRIHRMPASDAGADLDAAAAAYAQELGTTEFDVCLLGMGPDGHVASIFPEHPSAHADGRVIAVRGAPKPPLERISLTLETINRSKEVWFVVSGADKAAATLMALMGAGPVQVPAAGVAGRQRTLWLLDRESAGQLPADLRQRGRL